MIPLDELRRNRKGILGGGTIQYEGNVPAKEHGVPAVVVGLDIREYTRRPEPNQFYLTFLLETGIVRALEILRDHLAATGGEPSVIQPTGDGALLVFSTRSPSDREAESEPAEDSREVERLLRQRVDWAFSFVLVLHSILAQWNERWPIQSDLPLDPLDGDPSDDIYPIGVRYAMSMGRGCYLEDSNGCLSCVGDCLVTCSRILSTDRGEHFLIQDRIMHLILRDGGLERLAGGIWQQEFSRADLPEKLVKRNRLRYTDVHGHYTDEVLLRILGRRMQPTRRYYIGSHDILAIDR